jgi:hypothetical protein
MSALVFVGQVAAIAAAEAIDLTDQAERLAGQLDADGISFFVGLQSGVELAAGEDALVGDAQFLDLFEVEQARAIGQGVQGHDAHRRSMGVEEG